MDSLSYKTKFANSDTIEKKWFIVDVQGKTLGRVSSEISKILRGKNKVSFTPHVDCGDNVIVINSEGATLSGKKMDDKKYISHSGYTGGQKILSPKQVIEKTQKTAREKDGSTLEINGLVERAVRGMLPKNKLGREVIKNLFV